MDEKAKITLSAKELELVCDTTWILTKNNIIQKVYGLFATVASSVQQPVTEKMSLQQGNINIRSPKISKGENYKGLPYVMLDYPRCFEKEDTLAIRTFFWWGNFFSITLQLSGIHKTNAANMLVNNFSLLQNKGYWLCVSTDPWEHHFGNDNFKLVSDCTEVEFNNIIYKKPFIKIAKKIPVEKWKDVPVFLTGTFTEMLELLNY